MNPLPQAHTLADLLLALEGSAATVRYVRGGDRDGALSYDALLRQARGLLANFQQQGLQAGDPVLLFVRNNRAFVDAFWACQLGGLVPVPLSAGVHREYLRKLMRVAQRFSRPLLFTERALWQRLREAGWQAPPERVLLLEQLVQLQGEGELHTAAPGDTALIQYSSGSTGEPKGVVLSHAKLLANLRAITEAALIGPEDATLSWMPLSHDMGLVGFHLVPLANGLSQVIMDTDLFVRRPGRWLEAAQQYGSTLLCSPNFGYRHYLDRVETSPSLDLSRVRLIFNGAEPVSAPLCRDFAERLQPSGLNPDALFPVYGLAEAALAVTFPQPGSGVRSVRLAVAGLAVGDTVLPDATDGPASELVCLGFPVAGCELRICDDHGWTLPDYSLGHIQIRGANVTSGYHDCPPCDAAAFVDGWLDTGDLGMMTECGLLVSGRAREVLFVGGQNWYPQDLEVLLQEALDIGAGRLAVSAVRSEANDEDRLLVFVRFRRDHGEFGALAARVQAALAEHAGLHAHAVVPVGSIPHTSSGKPQRYRLRRAFEQGELAVPAVSAAEAQMPPQDDVERQLLELCRQLFPGQAIAADQNLFELGADSLMLVRIHEEIEARFPGRVEITDLFDHPTIAALAGYIRRP
ncbi:MAG TPA: AMP-dependent synthetase [Gammaproteobacteria bacterium]|nr:AMP-dependent synthetase [Gammaproteobacteria bacterium]